MARSRSENTEQAAETWAASKQHADGTPLTFDEFVAAATEAMEGKWRPTTEDDATPSA